jgi:hypothetical protein
MTIVGVRVESLSDDALLARVAEMVGRSRRIEAELVWHLAEVDRRRLYRREACPSMHVYATSRLHLSDPEAYLRIAVARVARRFPVVLAMLADGRLHLSGIARLAPHLREDNCDALLARAAHRSKREIEMLVATVAPQPDVPSGMRRLPGARAAGGAVGAAELRPDGAGNREVIDEPRVLSGDQPGPGRASTEPVLAGSARTATGNVDVLGGEAMPAAAGVSSEQAPAAGAGRSTAVMAPLSPTRYKVQFTVGEELHDKITRAQALLRHQIPDGDLAKVFDRAMTLLVRELERVRFAGTPSPRKDASEVDPAPSSRRIPDPIKREVWARDGEQCTFRDREGRRCPARERLEFHHLTPFAQGGDHSASNLTLRCASHNAHQADLDFGAAFMAARRAGGSVPRDPRGSGRCGESLRYGISSSRSSRSSCEAAAWMLRPVAAGARRAGTDLGPSLCSVAVPADARAVVDRVAGDPGGWIWLGATVPADARAVVDRVAGDPGAGLARGDCATASRPRGAPAGWPSSPVGRRCGGGLADGVLPRGAGGGVSMGRR